MKSTRRVFIVFAVVFASFLSPQAFGADVCSRVSEAEIAAAVGTQLQRNPMDPCRFGRATESVSVRIHPGGGSEFGTYVEAAKQQFPDAQSVSGVGSEAIFFGFSLGVHYKDDLIVVQMMLGKTKPEKLAMAKAVAQKVISHY